MHEYGEGAEQNFSEAARHYREAAARGHIPAFFSLGIMASQVYIYVCVCPLSLPRPHPNTLLCESNKQKVKFISAMCLSPGCASCSLLLTLYSIEIDVVGAGLY